MIGRPRKTLALEAYGFTISRLVFREVGFLLRKGMNMLNKISALNFLGFEEPCKSTKLMKK